MTAHPLRLESILQEPPEDLSDLSIELQLTLQDILNEKVLKKQVQPIVSNAQDLFLDDEFDDKASSFNKHPISFKNTITDSGGKVKSGQIATNDTSTETLKYKKIKKIQDEEVCSLLHNQLDNINMICTEKKIGLPSSVKTLGNSCLIIGTTLSSVIIFDIGQDEPIISKPEKQGYGLILTLAISQDQVFIACGCGSGFVFLIDRYTGSISKIIPPQILSVPITKLLFIGDDYSHLIKNDNEGNIYIYTIQKLIWQVGVISKRLLPHLPNTIYCDIKSITINRKKIVCLSSYDYVLCLMFFEKKQPQIIGKIIRPKHIKDKVPNIELGYFDVGGESKEGLFISWGSTLSLYYYNPLQRSNQFIFYKSLELDALIGFQIYSIHQLTKQLLLIIDNRNCFKLLNFSQTPYRIYLDYPITQGIISHKIPNKYGKFIKSFSNTVCKATLNNKDIYYISGTSIKRARLLGWTEYIRYLIQNSQWDRLFIQSLQMYKSQINAFSDTVDPSNKQIFESIINKYLENKFQNTTQKKILIVESIEYCLEIGLYNLLFNKIFRVFQKQGLAEVFIESLEPFITDNMVYQLPNNNLLEQLMILWSDTKPQLLESLLVQLNKASMDYLLTVQLCRKYNLQKGLLYISQINNDFITPLNRLIEISQKNSREQNKQQVISLIYQFIRHTSDCITISGNKTLRQQLVRNGLPRLVLWLLVEQNMEWLIDFNSQLYFQQIERLLQMGIVKYYLDEQFPDEDIIQQLFNNCQIMLERIRSSEVQKNLARCLLRASKLWQLNAQQSYYMLIHYNNPHDLMDLVKYLDNNYQQLKLNTDQWNKVLQKVEDEVKAIIDIKQGQQIKGLDTYEINKYKFNSKILFQHINQEQLLIHLEQLVRIDCKLCADSLFKTDIQKIPKYVRRIKFSLTKYLLMRYLFKLDSNNHISWGMEDYVSYIAALCKYREEERVLYQLNKAYKNYQFFPAYKESVLPIIKQYKLLLCEAFLSQPIYSFEIYKVLYKEVFQKNFQGLLKFQHNDGQDLVKIYHSLLSTLQKLGQNITSQSWFDLLQTILSPFKKAYKRSTVGEQIQKIYKMKGSQKNTFLITLMHIIQQSLLVVSSHITIDEMTHWMQNNLKILELKFIINCFCSTLKIYNQHTQTIQLSNEVITSDIISNFNNLIHIKTKGISLNLDCLVCHSPLHQQTSLIFPCGHAYHKECCSEIYLNQCKVCIEQQLNGITDYSLINQQIGTVKRQRLNSIRHKQSQQIFIDDKPSNMVYSFNIFDDMIHDQEQQYEKFKNIYEAYMILE